jgi:hypothetical protein
LIDGENADAALRATQLADQPLSAAAGSVSQSRVDDLYQLLVAGREWNGHQEDDSA